MDTGNPKILINIEREKSSRHEGRMRQSGKNVKWRQKFLCFPPQEILALIPS
jgi:hypothetical protein